MLQEQAYQNTFKLCSIDMWKENLRDVGLAKQHWLRNNSACFERPVFVSLALI